MLGIATSYRSIQFEGKRMIQTQENGKKNLILGLILVRSAQIQAAKIFFQKPSFVSL